MAKLLTPKVLLRGFEFFVLASVLGYGIVLYRSDDPLGALLKVNYSWLVAGLGLAVLDWVGGGLRNYVLAKNVVTNPSMKGMILSGGMSAWAAFLTPGQSGSGPMMVYTMKRYGVPVPVGVTVTFLSFIATVAFFAITGPIAMALGAKGVLGSRGVLKGISLYELFVGSLSIFFLLALVFVLIVIFPTAVRNGVHRVAIWLRKRSDRIANRWEGLERVIDQTHDAVAKFNSPRGWWSIFLATVLSGPSHANKLLAGYVALRAVGGNAPFVEILLLQVLVTFILYFFAPTPAGAGVGDIMQAAVMAPYMTTQFLPLHALIWRMTTTGYTLAFGFFVFVGWVRKGLKGIEQNPAAVGG